VEHQPATAVALVWLIDEWGVVEAAISDTPDGWRADVTLVIDRETYRGRGHAATPADAIRAAKLDVFDKAAS